MAPRERRIRQWAPLTALVLGLVSSAVGARLGYPNSWWFFAAGVAVAGVLALIAHLSHPRTHQRS